MSQDSHGHLAYDPWNYIPPIPHHVTTYDGSAVSAGASLGPFQPAFYQQPAYYQQPFHQQAYFHQPTFYPQYTFHHHPAPS